MSEWLQIVLAILGSAPILGGVGWFFQTRRADAIAEKLAYATEIKEQRATIFGMMQERIRDATDRSEAADRIAKALTGIDTRLQHMDGQMALLLSIARQTRQDNGSR